MSAHHIKQREEIMINIAFLYDNFYLHFRADPRDPRHTTRVVLSRPKSLIPASHVRQLRGVNY